MLAEDNPAIAHPKYKLIPEKGELIVGLIVLEVIFGIGFKDYSYQIIILLSTLIIGLFFIFIDPSILLYDDGFVVKKRGAKNEPTEHISYTEILSIRFYTSYGRGANSLTFYYKKNGIQKQCSFEFRGYIPIKELRFLKSKGVQIVFEPNGTTINL